MYILSKLLYNLLVEVARTALGAACRRYFVAVADAGLEYLKRYPRIVFAVGLVAEFEEGLHTSVVRVGNER